jgi:hypothetical protein
MQQAALFNWGLGLFGKPLPGGSLKPFVAALTRALGVRFEPADMDEVESMMSRSGANWQ